MMTNLTGPLDENRFKCCVHAGPTVLQVSHDPFDGHRTFISCMESNNYTKHEIVHFALAHRSSKSRMMWQRQNFRLKCHSDDSLWDFFNQFNNFNCLSQSYEKVDPLSTMVVAAYGQDASKLVPLQASQITSLELWIY